MMMKEMYEGKVNSPPTKLVASISTSDTVIQVEDMSAIPQAPNLLTIGTNTSVAETVKIKSIKGNDITVERGFEGEAKSWQLGAIVSRNFTAYDHNTFKDNIKDIDNKVDTIDDRVDNIIKSDVDGVSAQEIIDARDGKVTLGKKIESVENELTTHKEDYVQDRQQDQFKVATVEKGLNDYKSTMASVNVNQEAKQKVNGYGIVSLPKNSANGQVGVSLKGNTVTDETSTKSTVSASRLKSVDSEGNNTNELYLPNVGELRSLPNETKDEIKVSGGKAELVKRVSNNDILESSRAYELATHFSDILDAVYITGVNFISNSDVGNDYANIKFTDGRVISQNQKYNREIPWAYYQYNADNLRVTVPKGYFASLTEAQNYFMGATLTYQLAEPIITPINVSGILLSNPSGTVYVENVVADAGIYGDKLDVLHIDLPIKEVEKVSKVDFTTGVETELDVSQCVIAEDKLSFTHTNLTTEDIVFFTYYYDLESTLGETTIEYYDSRHTLKDDVTGKFYKIVPKISDGVLTNELVEV